MATSIISIAIAVAVLWIAYRTLFINSNRLVFNRAFLIIALGFSLILPAAGVFIGKNMPQINSYKQNLFQGIMLDEVVITADGVTISVPTEVTADDIAVASESTHSFDIWKYIWIIYIIGVGVMTLLFIIKLARLAIVIIRSPRKKMSGYTAVFTGKEHGSYSFFNYAFFPNENVSAEIVRHEMSHIAHHHSADILFVELMMILQWFNPFIYLYKRELQSLHEYMADRDVVATGIDKQNYMMLILQQCTAVDFSNMSNNFSFILTKKRLKMITQNKKAKGVVIKALLTLPLFALLLFANCQTNGQNNKPTEKAEAEKTVDTGKLTNFKLSDGCIVSFSDPFEITFSDEEAGISKTRYYFNLNDIKNDTTFMIGEHEIVAVKNHDEYNSLSVKIDGKDLDINFLGGIVKDDSELSSDPDTPATFPGGEFKMVEYLRDNLKYPESAKKKGIEGKVYIQFVVEKDGSIADVKVMRGVCEELDAEAVRVIKAMPKWKPGEQEGKPVRTTMMLPINFKINGETTTTALSGTKWKGAGEGTKDGVKYVMTMTMDFYNNNDGLFVMKLTSQEKGKEPMVQFENVGLDFKYSYDGTSSGSIQPKNTDGSTLGGDTQQPYSFVVKDGKIIVDFYDFKEDCGIEKITFNKKWNK
ncbi:MAG: M56 family metallopeptidase [Bacteroidales bacterium]|nr:M56 family metallopeptidase [Bacteroidales bacterium]